MRGPHDDEVLTAQASATPAAATAVAAQPIPGGKPLVSAMSAPGESIAGEASIAQAYIDVSPDAPPGPGAAAALAGADDDRAESVSRVICYLEVLGNAGGM